MRGAKKAIALDHMERFGTIERDFMEFAWIEIEREEWRRLWEQGGAHNVEAAGRV